MGQNKEVLDLLSAGKLCKAQKSKLGRGKPIIVPTSSIIEKEDDLVNKLWMIVRYNRGMCSDTNSKEIDD
jgi:hypothetical protein